MDAEVAAYGTCLDARGIGDEMMVGGIRTTMTEPAAWTTRTPCILAEGDRSTTCAGSFLGGHSRFSLVLFKANRNKHLGSLLMKGMGPAYSMSDIGIAVQVE
jgi:hypothetical protein